MTNSKVLFKSEQLMKKMGGVCTSSARLSSWLPGLKVMQGMRGMKGMQGMKGMLRKLDEGYVAEIAFAQGPR